MFWIYVVQQAIRYAVAGSGPARNDYEDAQVLFAGGHAVLGGNTEQARDETVPEQVPDASEHHRQRRDETEGRVQEVRH